MKSTKICIALAVSLALLFFLASTVWAQFDVGNFSITGSAEVGGFPRGKTGKDTSFETYRDLPETAIAPELQFRIGSKKEDYYLNFDSTKAGLSDQSYMLRFGRYGLVDVEFQWDQIPHLFSANTARSPYNGIGSGVLTLSSKAGATVTSNTASLGNPNSPTYPPTQGTQASATCGDSPFCNWLNSAAFPVDLRLYNGVGRFNLRYTPTPGWTFNGTYWSNRNVGRRAFGAYVGSSPGTYNVTEIPEPIDYQTHNVELGGEYAGKGWSLALKYNASLFHNNITNLVWDNPINLSGVGSACKDNKTYSNSSTTGANTSPGPCRSRMDLYPSNQAHTFTLTGTASLPANTHFLGTVSYGWRLQNDSLLPFTINSCYGSGAVPSTCGDASLTAMPTISKSTLNGNVRPLMVNATLVNNSLIDRLNLKGYYRLYNLANSSNSVTFDQGYILNDQGNASGVGETARSRIEYSKNTIGLDAGYDITRWLNSKLSYAWERMHRPTDNHRQITNSDEHTVGPTFDIKPWSWALLRASYRHSTRSSPHYEFEDDSANISRMVDEAARHRDKTGLFAQFTPWDNVVLYTGFDFYSDRYDARLGTQNDYGYSPSVGAMYSPLDWLRLFADYNWDRYDWLFFSMQRSSTTQNPDDPSTCDANCQLRQWSTRGREKIHTFSIGSDMSLIKDLLGFRIQYGFSYGQSLAHSSGSTCPSSAGLPFPSSPSGGTSACVPATDYPSETNMWHELLARLEYQIHKNVALNFGYYFNRVREKDPQVDIMQPWMGNYDQWSITGNANLGRSIFLGDRVKSPFTAHVGFITLRFTF